MAPKRWHARQTRQRSRHLFGAAGPSLGGGRAEGGHLQPVLDRVGVPVDHLRVDQHEQAGDREDVHLAGHDNGIQDSGVGVDGGVQCVQS